jgi:hypothetical protein
LHLLSAAPRIRRISDAARDFLHAGPLRALGGAAVRSTGCRSASWAMAAGRAAAGKAATGWRAVPAAAPARRPVP